MRRVGELCEIDGVGRGADPLTFGVESEGPRASRWRGLLKCFGVCGEGNEDQFGREKDELGMEFSKKEGRRNL